MKVILQRSLNSSVYINNNKINSIDYGLVILVGFKIGDNINDINYLVNKIVNMRIFDDENHIMNKSIKDVGGSILSISQFTLYADCKKGCRPSYIKAMKSDEANILYKKFNEELKRHVPVYEGIFGAEMKVSIINDGPITIILESGD